MKQLHTIFLALLVLCMWTATASYAQVAPYTEAFDSTSTPMGWSQSAVSGGPWEFPGTFSWNTSGCSGSPSDHTGNGGNYAALDFSNFGGNGGNDTTVILEMPIIDVSALTTPYLLFYHFMCASGYSPTNETYIEAYDGTDWNQVAVINTGAASWLEYGYDISSHVYSGNLVRIRFRAESGGSSSMYNGDIAIDDVSIKELPTCPNPSLMVDSNITAVSVDLGWAENGTATTWNLEWGAGADFAPGTGAQTGMATATTNATYSMTGLMGNTDYYVYYRSDCGGGDLSDWVGPYSFLTPCGALSLPQLEDFTAGFPPTPCWDEASNGTPATGPTDLGTGSWESDGFANNGFNGAVKINIFDAFTPISDWVLTPTYDLSTGSPAQVEFNFGVFAWNTSIPAALGADDQVKLLISTDGGVSWNDLVTYDNSYVTLPNGNKEVIDLTVYSGTVQFAFWGTDGTVGDPEDNDVFVDNFEVRMIPTCPDPTAIMASNIMATSADLSWTENGTATAWNLEWNADSDFTPGTGAQGGMASPTANPTYAMTGIMDNTTYYVYYQSDCGGGDLSTWEGPLTFTTPCLPLLPPQLEDFTASFPPTDCWDEASNGTPATGPTDLGTGSWTNDGFANNGFAGAVKISLSFNTDRDWLLTPSYDLSSGGPFQVEFDFGVFSGTSSAQMGSDDTIQVLISTDNGGTWNAIATYDSSYVTASGGNHEVIDLTAYSGVVRFGIWASEGTVDDPGFVDAMVDNFEVRAIPSCPEPLDMMASNITDTSADLEWVESDTATNWSLEWKAGDDFTPGTAGQDGSAAVTDTMYMLTGLTPATTYYVYYQANCDPGSASSWEGPYIFKTIFTPPDGVNCTSGGFSSTIFADGFETGNGWTGDIGTANGDWRMPNGGGNSSGTGPSDAQEGNFWAEYEASGNSSDVANLISPMIDLTNVQDEVELSFYMHAFGADIGALNVGVNTMPTGFFTPVYSWTGGEYQADDTEPWAHISVDLSAYIGQQIYIQFSYGGTGNGYEGDLALDLVEVKACQTCPTPSEMTASNDSSVTITDLIWMENGTATTWELEWKTGADFAPGMGEQDTMITIMTTPAYSATHLMPITTYYTYYRSICGAGDTSLWTGPYIFETPCAPLVPPQLQDFSAGFPPTACWDEASNGTPATGPTDFGTGDWTEDGFANSSSTGAVKVNLYNTGTNDWILSPEYDLSGGLYQLEFDFGVFEWNTSNPDRLGSDDLVQVLITIDSGATWTSLVTYDHTYITSPNGNHVMLPLGAYSGNAEVVRFAIWATEGITDDPEDIDVMVDNFEISLPPANDVGITSMMVGNCDSLENVTITLANFGTVTQTSIPVFYAVNGGMPVNEMWTGSLMAGMSTQYTFSLPFDAMPNSYNIMAGTTFAGDMDSRNDTSRVVIVVAPTLPTTFQQGFEGSTSVPPGWQADGLITSGHNAPSNVLYDNLWSSDQNFEVTLPKVGSITAGDELRFEYRYVDFTGSGSNATTLGDGDTLKVQISTDCGETFMTIAMIDSSNHMESNMMARKHYDLSAYAGERVIVRLMASWGNGDYYLDLDNFVIGQPLTHSVSSIDAACYGAMDGMAIAASMGGAMPHTYMWSDSQMTDTATSLAAGKYYVTITDAFGLSRMDSVMIEQPEAVVSSVANTDASCYGFTDGTASVTVTGGPTPYTYMWSNNADTTTIDGLGAGAYHVTITDSSGCMIMDSVMVGEPAEIEIDDDIEDVSCNGASDGSVALLVTGGVMPYTYMWNDTLGTSEVVNGLSDGTYSVTVTDTTGCTMETSFDIHEPTPLATDTVVVSDSTNSVAVVVPTGGTPPYSFQWDSTANNAITNFVNGLTTGTYHVTVTDDNGCTISDSVQITLVNVEGINFLTNLKVFPNPTTGDFTIDLQLSEAKDVNIAIYDMRGRLVQDFGQTNAPQIQYSTDFSQFPAGVYMIRFVIDKQVVTRRLILTK